MQLNLKDVFYYRLCESPHVVSLFGVVLQPNNLYFIMERMQCDLKKYLTVEALSEEVSTREELTRGRGLGWGFPLSLCLKPVGKI